MEFPNDVKNPFGEKSKVERKTVKSILKDSLIEVCSNTTAHAIPNIFRTENWIVRIYWLLLLIAATGGSLYCNLTYSQLIKENQRII